MSNADILADLARAKVVFQLRAIEAVIRGPAIAAGSGTAMTTKIGMVRSKPERRRTAASPEINPHTLETDR